jgi:hypothetical protein
MSMKLNDNLRHFSNSNYSNSIIKNVIKNLVLEKFHFKVEVGMDCYTEEEELLLMSPNGIEFCQFIAMLVDFQLNECKPGYLKLNSRFLSYFSAVIGLMSTIVVSATVYELLMEYRSEDNQKSIKKSQSPILCFSAYSNTKKLFSLKLRNKDLPSINGIKVITMIWIVISNVYLVGYQPQMRSFISIYFLK